ncbi:MAG TPA: hypothetical protein VGD84_00610 [Pseudonocardiaceae bacterium]
MRHPDRFARLVLVDGGHDFGVTVGDRDLDDVLTEVLDPSMRRVSMEFPTHQAFRDFWHQHPAFTDIWDDVRRDRCRRGGRRGPRLVGCRFTGGKRNCVDIIVRLG